MEIRYAPDPIRFQHMTTTEARDDFLVERLFTKGEIDMVYSDVDRAIVGSAVPLEQSLELSSADEIRAAYFCERRELGVLNIGGDGAVKVDGEVYPLAKEDGLYIGRGSETISFASADPASPAQFYLISYPAHTDYPAALARREEAEKVHLGSDAEANKRTVFKLIHPNGVKSCQLMMGFTELAEGSVWNTMPSHTHERRMEVYMYFNIPDSSRVFHFMGLPEETRHIIVQNGQAVISPGWSIHSGCGTSHYTFCWAMGGENQDFDDMDPLTMADLL
jgi:4-deoxy-L-threo-5-hexosulose-uronate ketol-isomerase